MRSKVLEIAYVSTPASPTSSVFTTGGIVSSLTFSWHETQAVYSVDFQPLPISQLKRLLHTGTDEEGVKGKDAAATPTSKEKERVDGGMSTPVASTSGSAVASGSAVVARSYRMATAGGDSKVRLWMVHPNVPPANLAAQAAATGQEFPHHPPRTEYLATLSKHTAPVNVVRFSPNGHTLASAGDADGNVILWIQSDRPTTSTFGEAQDDAEKEHWRLQKMIQITTKHVYDIAWSPDSEFFIAGSTDNTATIWKAATGECVYALREHAHNVQGVSWDPLNEYIATQSSDRSVHVNGFAFRGGVPDVHPVSRANRMEIKQSRTPSFPSGIRPQFARRGSTASDAGSAITTASELPEAPSLPSALHAGAPATPSASIPSTPNPGAATGTAMNPPSSTKPGSRRSSFSGSQAANSPALSAAVFAGRGRSPSPIPPLPAIRVPPTSSQAINQRLYGDEGTTRFFRRLSFSPDGSLLITPAGQIEDQLFKGSPLLMAGTAGSDGADLAAAGAAGAGPSRPKAVESGKPTVYIYTRANLGRHPVAHLPGHKTSSVAIKFNPIFYDLRTGPAPVEPKQVTLDKADQQPVHVSLSMPPPPVPNKEKEGTPTAAAAGAAAAAPPAGNERNSLGSVFALPYRLVYAVACQDSVLLYDTQQAGPIAIFRGLHYAGFNDIAWSPDGQTLMLCSSDGYCSIVVFDLAELGSVHPTQQHHRQLAAIAQSHSHSHTAAVPAPLSTPTPTPPASTAARDSVSLAGTPAPLSPAVSSVMRQSPAPGNIGGSGSFSYARSDREGSTSSSIAGPGSSHMSLPLPSFHPPASTASSTTAGDAVFPDTPADEMEGYTWKVTKVARSESESTTASAAAHVRDTMNMGLGFGQGQQVEDGGIKGEKRPAPPAPSGSGDGQGQAGTVVKEEGGAKKKRRVALTHLGSEEQ